MVTLAQLRELAGESYAHNADGSPSMAFTSLANAHFHYGTCKRIEGPRGGVKVQIEDWRVNGQLKTWKRDPERFSLPIKYGLRDYTYLTNINCASFHLDSECPLSQSV